MQGWIGVDLDGTLAHYDGWVSEDHVGKPIELMCYRVREWLKEGKKVKIMTARVYGREGKELERVLRPINEFCMNEFGQVLDVTCVKDYAMIELWDDRAVQVVANTGMTHESLTRFIATDRLEMSHEKVEWQRNNWRKLAEEILR